MKTWVPAYYLKFQCIAGRCRHNCCIGWEIDIDEETYAGYRKVGGEFGEKLRAGIDTAGETPCFRLGADERCAFLNGQGLCDIITELGENALCEICALHPRYRNFFRDRVEMGLGLCCEEAAKLILTAENPTAFEETEIAFEENDEFDENLFEVLFEARSIIILLLGIRKLRLRETRSFPQNGTAKK